MNSCPSTPGKHVPITRRNIIL